MKITEMRYVKTPELLITAFIKDGYSLELIEKSANVEIRYYLDHPEKDSICLVRQFWDEFYPEASGNRGFPDNYLEIRTQSEKEFKDFYLVLKSLGIVSPVQDDDLTSVAVLRLNTKKPALLVCPKGYTWE